jgi:FixJ family two-component response regulator
VGSISVIDDDRAVREATKGLLRSLGYVAASFDCAEAFLSSDEFSCTSCIVTDIRMPGMGGIALQALLIENGHKFPIIFMTAFPDEDIRRHVLAAGASGYLVKPCDQSLLVGCIEDALRH